MSKVKQFFRDLTFIEYLIMSAIGFILLAIALGAGNVPKTQIKTVCLLNGEEVFNEITQKSRWPLGEKYWQVDDAVIYADICVSNEVPVISTLKAK